MSIMKIPVYLIDFTLEMAELGQWDIDLYIREKLEETQLKFLKCI